MELKLIGWMTFLISFRSNSLLRNLWRHLEVILSTVIWGIYEDIYYSRSTLTHENDLCQINMPHFVPTYFAMDHRVLLPCLGLAYFLLRIIGTSDIVRIEL